MLDDKTDEELSALQSTARQIGYLPLFPSLVYKYEMPPALLEEMQEHIKDIEGTSIDVMSNPKFDLLKRCVQLSCDTCVPSTDKTGEWKAVTGWINNQKPDEDGFGFHGHCDSFMSSVAYLAGENIQILFRDSPKTTEIASNENRSNYDLLVRHTWYGDQVVDVKPGDILYFPSYLLHKQAKNTGSTNRVSVAYNIVPDRVVPTPEERAPWFVQFKI